MGLREWIIVIAVLVMLGILADALRRIWRQRQMRAKLTRNRGRLNAGQTRGDRSRDRILFDDPELTPEGSDAPLFAESSAVQPELKPTSEAAPEVSPKPAQPAMPAPDFDEQEGQRIPMLLDAVQPEVKPSEPSPRTDQFALNLPEAPETPEVPWPQWDEPLVIDESAETQVAPTKPDEPVDLDWDEPAAAVRNPQDAALSDQLLAEPEEVLVVTVLAAAEESFDGPSLLQLMLACGLRFGHMSIFHASDAQGHLQYSVANAFKPGTFDLDALDQLSTRGVTFFLQLPCQAEPLEALSAMQHSATLLAETLGGTLLDDQRNVMTAQTLTHYHERVRAFQRAQLNPRS
jgi:cell division protein ZipA